ncbi:hypothetical protein E2562_003315 [Oryza meyeriana var. granulata]|uniref:Uncharacterized protein n=1 Tax=Oryza meyeriana var. granulata TaxID=110450 RepID=A0A6G1EE81_9ORYZ|nr:hypothetical protein E2562_003315 [Oryza meyeriana var. granulata]
MEDEVLMEAVVQCAAQMYRDDITMQDNIVSQLTMYTEATSSFGKPMAIRQRNMKTIPPANWWSVHGDPDAPAPQLEDDAQSGSVRGKRRLIHKSSSSKAKKARVVAKDEEEEFDSSESEEEEEENIPYADRDGSSDHEADDVVASGNDD